MAEPVRRTLEIVNDKGLHARAAARFVETVERFEAEVEVARDGMSAGGDSIMGLLMLGAGPGSSLTITATGPDAATLADALERLVADRFGEMS